MLKPVKDPQVLHSVIQEIYSCVPQPEKIQQVVQNIGCLLDAPYTSFQVENRFTHKMKTSIMTGYDDSALQKYGEYFVYHDPWTQEVVRRGLIDKGFTLCQSLVPDKQFCNTEFYQDWGKSEKVRHAVGTNFTLDDAFMLKIALQRHDDQQAFDEDEAAFLNLIRPHIKQFVRLSNLYARQNIVSQSWREGFDRLKRGVWILDGMMNVIYHNEAAAALISDGADEQSKHWIDIKAGTLKLSDSPAQKNLAEVVSKLSLLASPAITGAGVNTEILTNSLYESVDVKTSEDTETLWVAPLPVETRPGLVIVAARESLTTAEEIQQIFGLPPRQAQLCALLVRGNTVQECAEALNISLNTTRNTLVGCYRRLKVNNQSTLR